MESIGSARKERLALLRLGASCALLAGLALGCGSHQQLLRADWGQGEALAYCPGAWVEVTPAGSNDAVRGVVIGLNGFVDMKGELELQPAPKEPRSRITTARATIKILSVRPGLASKDCRLKPDDAFEGASIVVSTGG